MTEKTLLGLTGSHEQKSDLHFDGEKKVFDGGQKGYHADWWMDEIVEEAVAVHKGYWD